MITNGILLSGKVLHLKYGNSNKYIFKASGISY